MNLTLPFASLNSGRRETRMASCGDIAKLQAICIVCGAPASRTQRLINGRPALYDDPIIMVGASEVYEARCRTCHQVPRRESA